MRPRHGGHVSNPTQMGFTLTRTFPAEVKVCEPQLFVKAGFKDGIGIYAVGEPGRFDAARAGMVKRRLIDYWKSECNSDGSAKEMTVGSALAEAERFRSEFPGPDFGLLAYLAAHDAFGYGPFGILMGDSANIEEIVLNSPGSELFVYHSKLGLCRTNLKFRNETTLRFSLNRTISREGKELNSGTPIIDTRLLDGSRLHAQLSPYAPSGAIVSIRLSSARRAGPKLLIDSGAFDPEALAYIWMALESGMSILVAGSPASGKTTLVLSMLKMLPPYQRVVVIEEDTGELDLGPNFANAVNLQGRQKRGFGIVDQVINSLHIRPERLVVGELRGREARALFSAANLGIPFMTTVHSAASGRALLDRLSAKPMSVERNSLRALDVAVFMRKDGAARGLCGISEYHWVADGDSEPEAAEDGRCVIVDVAGQHGMIRESFRSSKVLARFSSSNSISLQKTMRELKRRTSFLSGISNIPSGFDESAYMRTYGA